MNVRPATLIPSGVSDEAGSIGAVASDDGLLDVIDLCKGKRIALSESPMCPLFLRRQELLVWTREPESYAILSALYQIGVPHLKRLWTTELPLPEWVFDDAATLTFDVEWGHHTFHISWTARRVRPGGMVRSDEYERAQAGFIQLDEKSGAIVHTEEREPAFVDPQDAYDLALSLELIPCRRGPDRLETPWSVDGREIFLTRRGLGGKSGVFLRVRGNDEEPEEREAALSNHAIQEPVVTTDRRTIMLFNGAEWDLYSALDGTAQGSLPMEQEAEDVSIFGSRVIYALDEKEFGPYQVAARVRRCLRARDRQSGTLLWSYFLYDRQLPPDPRTIPAQAPPSKPGRA